MNETRELLLFGMLMGLLATPLSSLAAILLLRRYRRRIAQLTGQVAAGQRTPRATTRTVPSPPPATSDEPDSCLPDDPNRLESAVKRAAALNGRLYALASATFVISAIVLHWRWLDPTGELDPVEVIRLLIAVALVTGFPFILTARMVFVPSRRNHVILVCSYAATMVLLGISSGQSRRFTFVVLWLFLPPLILLLTSAPRAFRGASWLLAPLVTLTFVAVPPVVALPLYPQVDDGIVLSVSASALLIVAVVVVTIWRLYQRHHIGEQTVAISLWWFYQSFWLCTLGALDEDAGWEAYLGLAPFLLFALVLTVGHRVILRRRTVHPGYHLLLLRPFVRGRRNVALLRDIVLYWRYAGAVIVISGSDLATETLEPDELIQWFRGRIAEQVLRSPSDAPVRLEGLRLSPGADGQYRVHDLICTDDAWQAAVETAARLVSVVVIDLRAFTEPDSGLAWEVQYVHGSVAAGLVVLTDNSTNPSILEPLSRAEPPSRSTPWADGYCMLQQQGSRPVDARRLLRAVSSAAVAGSHRA